MPDPGDALDVMSIHETSIFTTIDRKKFRDLIASELARGVQGSSHHSRRNLKDVALLHMSVFGSPKVDSIRNACEQVLDALDFQKGIWSLVSEYSLEKVGGFNIWRIYPVILFNGPIWILRMDAEGNLIPTRAEFITYNYRRRKDSYLIDIISQPHFENYIDILEEELASMWKITNHLISPDSPEDKEPTK